MFAGCCAGTAFVLNCSVWIVTITFLICKHFAATSLYFPVGQGQAAGACHTPFVLASFFGTEGRELCGTLGILKLRNCCLGLVLF